VRVVDGGVQADLAADALEGVAGSAQVRADDLEGDVAGQREVPGAVHDAHPPAAHVLLDDVVADLVSGRKHGFLEDGGDGRRSRGIVPSVTAHVRLQQGDLQGLNATTVPPVRHPLNIVILVLLMLVPAAPAVADPPPKFRPSPEEPVAGQAVSFEVERGDDDERYSWSFGDGSGADGPRVSHVYAQPGTYTVRLEARDDDDFESVTRNLTVRPAPVPPVPVPPVPTPTPTAPAPGTSAPAPGAPAPAANGAPLAGLVATTEGLRVTLGSTARDPDGDALAHAWSFGDGGGSTQADTSHTFARAGSYTVRLTVSDGRGGTDTVAQVITVSSGTTSTTSAGSPAAGPAPVAGGSASSAPPASRTARRLSPFPVIRIAGRLLGTRTRIRVLSVLAPRGATISVRCRGRGCVRRTQRLVTRTASTVRLRRFEGRSMAAGSSIEVAVSRAGLVGKHTRFTFRARRSPLRADRCLAPGSTRPVTCR
jgi:PKD repeat protein